MSEQAKVRTDAERMDYIEKVLLAAPVQRVPDRQADRKQICFAIHADQYGWPSLRETIDVQIGKQRFRTDESAFTVTMDMGPFDLIAWPRKPVFTHEDAVLLEIMAGELRHAADDYPTVAALYPNDFVERMESLASRIKALLALA